MSTTKTIKPTNQDFRSKLDEILDNHELRLIMDSSELDIHELANIEAIEAIITLIDEGVPKSIKPSSKTKLNTEWGCGYNSAIADIRTNLRIKGEVR